MPHTEAIERIAGSIVKDSLGGITKNDYVLLRYDAGRAEELAYFVNKAVLANKGHTLPILNDPRENARRIRESTPEQIPQIFDEDRITIPLATKAVYISSSENREVYKSIDPAKYNLFFQAYKEAYQTIFSGQIRSILLEWPTPAEAEIEGLTYDQYFKEFIIACDQDWLAIHNAHQILIGILEKGKELRFVTKHPDSSKRTDIRLSVAGSTYANSTIALNYPGSEVFTAPVIDSVEGQLYAPGRFIHQGTIIQGIHLLVSKGRVTEASAEKGEAALLNLLSDERIGEGMKYFGEVAFGTNRGLIRQFMNRLLVEKMAGTVHMALGFSNPNSYYKDALGKTAAVNENTMENTPYHLDIVIPMFRGRVLLDDRVIQRNGRFIDERLAILNPLPLAA